MSSKAKEASVGKVTLHVKKIGRKRYGAARCFVSGMGNNNTPAVAVLAGKEKWISTFDDCVLWLSKRGLTYTQARDFINEAAVNDRLGPDAGAWTIRATYAQEHLTASSPHVIANLHGDIATCESRHVATRLTHFPALLAIVRELAEYADDFEAHEDRLMDAEAAATRLSKEARELLAAYDAGELFPKE